MKVKFKVLSIMIVAVVLLGLVFFILLGLNGTFKIEIKNNTSETIRGLKITYNKIQKDILIPSIPSKSSYKIQITPHENFGENVMWITYKDNKGGIHKETVFGYFEKGYSGRASINIVSIKENGIIQFKIKSEIKI